MVVGFIPGKEVCLGTVFSVVFAGESLFETRFWGGHTFLPIGGLLSGLRFQLGHGAQTVLPAVFGRDETQRHHNGGAP